VVFIAARPITPIVALLTATTQQGGPDVSSSNLRGVMGVRNELRERSVTCSEDALDSNNWLWVPTPGAKNSNTEATEEEHGEHGSLLFG
jgi:hypothetical protein